MVTLKDINTLNPLLELTMNCSKPNDANVELTFSWYGRGERLSKSFRVDAEVVSIPEALDALTDSLINLTFPNMYALLAGDLETLDRAFNGPVNERIYSTF